MQLLRQSHTMSALAHPFTATSRTLPVCSIYCEDKILKILRDGEKDYHKGDRKEFLSCFLISWGMHSTISPRFSLRTNRSITTEEFKYIRKNKIHTFNNNCIFKEKNMIICTHTQTKYTVKWWLKLTPSPHFVFVVSTPDVYFLSKCPGYSIVLLTVVITLYIGSQD